MKDYAIQVHGLKGNARTLGADQLADMAFAHEEQSKAGNLEYVKKHWQELLLIWENTLDGFQEFINTYGGKQLDKYSAVSGDGSDVIPTADIRGGWTRKATPLWLFSCGTLQYILP